MDPGPHSGYFNLHGGLDVITNHFASLSIWRSIDEQLGARCPRAVFSNAQVIQMFILNRIAGARRMDHAEDYRGAFLNNPCVKKSIGPDAISKIVRRLAGENNYYTLSTKATAFRNARVLNPSAAQKLVLNEVNSNTRLNALLFDSAVTLGLLLPGQAYELDLDATFVTTKVSDGRRGYIKGSGPGYCPMVAMLGGIPLYMEARNGNSSPAFNQLPVLKAAIEMAAQRGIGIKFVRIDAAGANSRVLNYLTRQGIPYYIRANEGWLVGETSLSETAIKIGKRQLVVTDGQGTIKGCPVRLLTYEADSKTFKIITNDLAATGQHVIGTYNQRGAMEQRFADLKELGWRYMAHRELKYNTVYMLLIMLSYIFFIYARRWLAKKVKVVKETMKPATLVKKFIQVVSTWMNGKIRFLDRNRVFAPLEGFT